MADRDARRTAAVQAVAEARLAAVESHLTQPFNPAARASLLRQYVEEADTQVDYWLPLIVAAEQRGRNIAAEAIEARAGHVKSLGMVPVSLWSRGNLDGLNEAARLARGEAS